MEDLLNKFSNELKIKSKKQYVDFVNHFISKNTRGSEDLLRNFAFYVYFLKKDENLSKKTIHNYVTYLNKFRKICGEDTSKYFFFTYKVKYNGTIKEDLYESLQSDFRELSYYNKDNNNSEIFIRIESIEDGCLIFKIGILNIFDLSKGIISYIKQIAEYISEGKEHKEGSLSNLIIDGIILILKIGSSLASVFGCPLIFEGIELTAELIQKIKDYLVFKKEKDDE